MGEGNVFSLSIGGYLPPTTPPGPGQDRGRGYPKVPSSPPPRQGTYPPGQVRRGGEVPQGTYLTWQGTYPPLSRSGWGVRGYPKVPTPSPGQGTYPPPPPSRSGWGEGVPQGTYPPPPAKVPTPYPRSGWGRGYPKVPPLHQDRTAYGVPDTLRSVCLLGSRRTFLF